MRTFKRSELEGVTGWLSVDGVLRICPLNTRWQKDGTELDTSHTDDECRRCKDTPLTGDPLVAALRERGVEVVDDTVSEKIIAGLQSFKEELEAKAKPEVKPAEADQLRQQLNEAIAKNDDLHERNTRLVDRIGAADDQLMDFQFTMGNLRKELATANETITRLRDSLTKAENDRLQPPMSDERFLQQASIAAMQGMMASGNETTFPLTGEGSQNLGAWAVDYAELTLKALKARKEGQQ